MFVGQGCNPALQGDLGTCRCTPSAFLPLSAGCKGVMNYPRDTLGVKSRGVGTRGLAKRCWGLLTCWIPAFPVEVFTWLWRGSLIFSVWLLLKQKPTKNIYPEKFSFRIYWMHLAIITTSKNEFSRFGTAGNGINKYPFANHYPFVSHYKTERVSV